MKKLRIVVIVSLIFGGVAGCCTKTVQPEMGMFSVDTTFEAGSTVFDVQYEFTSIVNASASPALKAIEEANIAYFFSLESFAGTAREAAAEAIAQLIEEHGTTDAGSEERGPGFEVSVTVTSEATVVDTVLVYSIGYAGYTGGAHGIYGQSMHNYSIANGYELTLNDLFDERQLQGLKGLVRTKLYEEFGVAGDEGLAEQGFFPEYIDVTENFAVTERGIVFYYNPYDIGCYALGAVEVSVDRKELDAL